MQIILHVVDSVAKTLKAMDIVPTIIKLLAPEGLSVVLTVIRCECLCCFICSLVFPGDVHKVLVEETFYWYCDFAGDYFLDKTVMLTTLHLADYIYITIFPSKIEVFVMFVVCKVVHC